MSATLGKQILVCITAILYVIHLIFNGLAGKGGSKLFPINTGAISDGFYLEMTPTGSTFTIWGFIFFFQLIWIVYSVVNLFRTGDSTDILSTRFFVCFILNIVLITIWLILWSRRKSIECFLVITVGQILLDLTIAFACVDLNYYLLTHEFAEGTSDVWCQRILVQNGLLFYATWTTAATLLNMAIVLAYNLNLTTVTASLLSLSLLGVIAVIWFILENFVLRVYTEYTFSAYIALIYALSGIFSKINGQNSSIAGLALGLLILSVIMLAARVLIIIFSKHVRKHV